MYDGGSWQPLTMRNCQAHRRRTAPRHRPRQPGTPLEMIDSRDAVAAILAARARRPRRGPVCALRAVADHRSPPPSRPKRARRPRRELAADAPEAYARFPLALLGVREDAVAEEGDTTALDSLGSAPRGTGCCRASLAARSGGRPPGDPGGFRRRPPRPARRVRAARRPHGGDPHRLRPGRPLPQVHLDVRSPTTSAGCGATTCSGCAAPTRPPSPPSPRVPARPPG